MAYLYESNKTLQRRLDWRRFSFFDIPIVSKILYLLNLIKVCIIYQETSEVLIKQQTYRLGL